MFVIRVILVSCFGFVILGSAEAKCIRRNADTLYCEHTANISQELLNQSYENITILSISDTIEPLIGMPPFKNIKNLTNIYIITSPIGIIYSKTFNDLPYLKEVQVRFNTVRDIEVSAFYNLPKLEFVSIAHVFIQFLRKGIFQKVPKLSLISFQYSNLYYIQGDAFYDVPNLKVLNLQNNQLTVVMKDMLYNLINLDVLKLADNRISIIDKHSFDATPHLSELDLNGNLLKALDLDMFPTTGMKYLQKIYFNRNQLMYLPSNFFTRTPALQELGLSHNPWFCPCLFEIYGNLNQYNITEVWYKEMPIIYPVNYGEKPIPYSPWRLPICINRNVSDINCTNTYNQKLSENYLKYITDYNEFFGHYF